MSINLRPNLMTMAIFSENNITNHPMSDKHALIESYLLKSLEELNSLFTNIEHTDNENDSSDENNRALTNIQNVVENLKKVQEGVFELYANE